ncbi:hypothetical protein ACWGMA_40815 [Streptomyces asiaticus]
MGSLGMGSLGLLPLALGLKAAWQAWQAWQNHLDGGGLRGRAGW